MRFRVISPALCVAFFVRSALAHTAAEEAAEVGWSFEPGVVIPLVLTLALFTMGAARRWNRPGRSNSELLFFLAGWITLFAALISPIHKLGAQLFSVHMTQHEMLMIVAAPLLVLSRPLVWFLWALPLGWREWLGCVSKRNEVAAVWETITAPLFAWLLHAATLWVWHIPALYQAGIEREWVHSIQHIAFLSTALLFWWTLLARKLGGLGYGLGVIYCFTTAVHTSVLGALMTFARQVWYPIYDGRTATFHLTALEDQQLGGLIMWVPAGIIYIVLGLWLMASWIKASDLRLRYTQPAQLSDGDPHA